ncbi:MAG: hypothetical protein R3B70_45570 [Polyangiaceae bacterium]
MLLLLSVWLARPAPEQERAAVTWESLIAPLAVGQPVALGYVLGPPRRGEEHDVVFSARSPGAGTLIEVHILDRGRWSDIRETASFGVAYETPRSSAQVADCETVTEAIASALRARDTGGLGAVDAIPLRSEPPPPGIARSLSTMVGFRAVLLGACLSGLTWILASMPGGAWAAGVWLAVLGALLRAPSLSVPFAHDQDVQRLFTGHLPISQIVSGIGLQDRHPPLYFLVLHVAERFGQSEAVARAPAVVAGVLAGPAIVWGARVHRRRLDVAALAGLVVVLSVELIARSREVSSIPLIALLAIVWTVSLAKHAELAGRKSRRRWAVVVVVSLALLSWTTYLAPFFAAGPVLALLALRRLPRATLCAVGLGLAASAPALVLGALTFFRDRAARAAAAAHPDLAWGERGFGDTARSMAQLAAGALGVAVLVILSVAVFKAARERDPAALAPAASLLVTFLGISALAPVARVQPYYLAAALPLAMLCVALSVAEGVASAPCKWRWPFRIALAASVSLYFAPHLSGARALYLPPADAFAPVFAEAIHASPEQRIVPVAHYDGTLIAYYLARRAGVPMDWSRIQPAPEEPQSRAQRLVGLDRILEPLAESHHLDRDPDSAALDHLERLLQHEPVLVIERDAFLLPGLHARLQRCRLLSEAGTGRLYRCFANRHAP